jgi:Uma2 family endonuclease
VTIELDRFTSLLEHVEVPEGFKAELVHGEIILSPLRSYHFRTAVELMIQLRPQLPQGLSYTGDSITPFPAEDSDLCPDIAFVPASESDKNLAVFAAEIVEVAIEVVSPSTARRDYDLKPGVYGRAGIPIYLIADPYRAELVIYSLPGGDGYLSKLVVPYGKTATIPTEPPMTLDTSVLPTEQ